MGKDIKEHQWRVYGKCVDPKSKPPVCNAPITLPEQNSGLGMRMTKPPQPYSSLLDASAFGTPVEADIAIDMIRTAYLATKPFFEDAFTAEKGEKASHKLAAANNLFSIAYGVTFDKTIILKILSQPNCEGLRSYLCARTLPSGELHYSLVMVGVDIDGYDLNYPPADYSKVKMDNSPSASVVTTQSLVGEYGNPPGGPILLHLDAMDDIPDHYYLLKCAVGNKPVGNK